jgi:hypothetical protein
MDMMAQADRAMPVRAARLMMALVGRLTVDPEVHVMRDLVGGHMMVREAPLTMDQVVRCQEHQAARHMMVQGDRRTAGQEVHATLDQVGPVTLVREEAGDFVLQSAGNP